jgi:hypothetical protein
MAAREVIESQLRECFGRVAYSHKTHEKAADIALRRLATIKTWQIVLSAIITGGLLTAVLGPSNQSRLALVVAAIVSTGLLALNAFTKENDLGKIAQLHKEAADKIWMIRESYLSLLADLWADIKTIEQACSRRDELQAELAAVYSSAPRTNDKAYTSAQKALKVSEDLTFSDVEIDKLLPGPLRKA